jgi:lipopolysaccharide transport system ATP-binding protein
MSNTIIHVENISKMYQLGEVGTGTLSHDLNRWWHKVRGKEDPYLKLGEENRRDKSGGNYVWALRDINFDVKQGEVLGIIGRNGAGKSTLLKILSRVTQPTTGFIKAKGRIASLLEVGTGFHPELTGRDNIYLNGAILGMTKQEIRKKFDEIVSFSGVERYIDTPVKRYSSGMYVRLAFAVAAHLEPEILIVDEVLAVGDAEFQNRCMGKMGEVSRTEGRTVLFVSHNMGAVKQLCDRSVLVERGRIKTMGDTINVIEEYLSGDNAADRFIHWSENERPKTNELELISVKVLDKSGKIDNMLTTTDEIKIEIEYELKTEIKDLRVAINLLTPDGIEVFSSSDFYFQHPSRIRNKGRYKSICNIPGSLLNLGKYIIRIDFDIPRTKALIMDIPVEFTISELMYNQLGHTIAARPTGVVHPYINWDVVKM